MCDIFYFRKRNEKMSELCRFGWTGTQLLFSRRKMVLGPRFRKTLFRIG